MSTITKEQAQKIIEAADEVITALAGTNEDVHPDNSTKMVQLYDDLNDHYAPPEVVRELARIALASLEAEPMAEVCEGFTLRYIGHGPAPKSGVRIGDRLYAAPPAPVWCNPLDATASSTAAEGKNVYLLELISGAVWLVVLIVLVVLAVRRIDC